MNDSERKITSAALGIAVVSNALQHPEFVPGATIIAAAYIGTSTWAERKLRTGEDEEWKQKKVRVIK